MLTTYCPCRTPQESSAMRSNYPETYNYLKAKKARHPRDDAIEDFTEWQLLGTKADLAAIGNIPKPGASLRGDAPPQPPAPPKKEETEEDYVSRRCEEYMHKTLSSRCAAEACTSIRTHARLRNAPVRLGRVLPAAEPRRCRSAHAHAPRTSLTRPAPVWSCSRSRAPAVAGSAASSSRLAAAETAACRTRSCRRASSEATSRSGACLRVCSLSEDGSLPHCSRR